MAKDKGLLRIFLTMLRLGALTFGGGYAMVPLFEDEFVHKRGWISEEDMCNMVALSQSVPGAIAINCGILIGYRLQKIKGVLVAVAGIILPSVVVLTAVTYIYEAMKENALVAGALRGIRAAVVALLISAFVRFMKPFKNDIVSIAVFIAAFCLSIVLGLNSIYIILGAVVFGITVGIWRVRPEKNEPPDRKCKR